MVTGASNETERGLGEKTPHETYLLVKLNEGGLELLLNVLAVAGEVVGELVVRERHALGSFLGSEVTRSSVRHGVHGHRLVLDILDFAKVDVRDLFMLRDGRVVRWCVTGQFREVL